MKLCVKIRLILAFVLLCEVGHSNPVPEPLLNYHDVALKVDKGDVKKPWSEVDPVLLGALEIRMRFVNLDLPKPIKEFITYDISGCFQHLTATVAQERGNSMLMLNGKARIWPTILDEVNRIEYKDEKPYLIISKKVSDEYQMKLQELLPLSSEILKTPEVLRTIFRNIKDNASPEDLSHLVFFSKDDSQTFDTELVKEQKGLANGRIIKPSILSFYQASIREEKLLCFRCIRIVEKNDVVVYSEPLYFVFKDKKWMLLL